MSYASFAVRRLSQGLLAAIVVALLASVAAAQKPAKKLSDEEKLSKPTARTQAKLKALVAEDVQPELLIELDPRVSKVFHTKKQVTRISVTRPEIVEVTQFSPTELEMIPGQVGKTTVTIWFGDQSLRYLVRVERKDAAARR